MKGFTEKAYQLIFLWLMKDESVYGYELATRFEKMTNGHIRLSYGTVYPLLRRMEKRGLISSKRDESSGRIYYELTSKGKLSVEKLSSRIKDSREYFNEKLLGFLAIYIKLFGRQALDELLQQT